VFLENSVQLIESDAENCEEFENLFFGAELNVPQSASSDTAKSQSFQHNEDIGLESTAEQPAHGDGDGISNLSATEESPSATHSRSRQPDSESDFVDTTQQAKDDIDEGECGSVSNDGTIEKLAKMKFDPSTKDFVIKGNLNDVTGISSAITRVSRQESITRQESLGTIGGRNVQFNFIDCNIAKVG